MRTTTLPLACALLLVCAFVASTGSAEIVIDARLWSSDVAGKVRVNGSSLIETIDLTEDLGLEGEEGLDGRLLIRPSRRTLVRVGWLPVTLNGDRVVSRTLRFLGRDFQVSSRVVSELELEYGRLGFAWQFLSSGDGRFRVGPLVEAKGFRGTATLEAPDLPFPARESEEFEVAFASAGILIDLEPTEKLHIFGEGTTLLDDGDGDLTDVEVGVRLFIAENLSLTAGIRRLELDAVDDNDLLNLELDGAFVGASLHF